MRPRQVTFTIVLLLITLTSLAQKGKIEGKITDSKTGNKLLGVSISIDGNKTGTASNTDGYFIITVDAGKKHIINLTSVGYAPKEITDVEVAENQLLNLDLQMETTSKTEALVTIKSSSAKKETINALIAYQKNTPVVAQVISAEAIRRSPDKNTGEVLKRVPGTSVQDGKYLVVRGLADRYNQAMLNGFLLGSTEPDRKTFSFDIIPSAMVDNIIVNKSFIPEMPGEWAGGLIQVNTKDVPAKDFLSIQVGTGFNTQTIGKDFYTYKGGSTDFLGFDDGTRALPASIPLKGDFDALSPGEKTSYAKDFKNIWSTDKTSSNILPLLHESFQINGGFNTQLSEKTKLAAILAVNYNRTNKRTEYENQINSFQNNTPDLSFSYLNNKYSQDILAGALANLTLQIGNNDKISFKNLLNVNTTDYATLRNGKEFENATSVLGDNIKANELAFKANTFFTTQLSGDHNLYKVNMKLHWFGSFNILDQSIPDQRRIQYIQNTPEDPSSPFLAAIGQSNSSQKSGSRYYGTLSDYIYTAGGDLSKTFVKNGLAQTVKGGYFFQVKDRLFDSRPFAVYLPINNETLRGLAPDKIFAAENYGDGSDNKFALNELTGTSYRYMANSILNAGFLQFDNQFSSKLRVVWGLRIENFDQLIGSVKQSDPRHLHSKKTDYLPGLNFTYKVNATTNIRVSGSQTVIRPEFRELSTFQFYDFDLGATVAGNANLERTKVSNFDIRYELYPRAGELFTFGVFYKYFKSPIEVYFNASSGASSSTYNYLNANEANSFGAEMEFRKKLDFSETFKNFTVQGNLSYIYNRVTGVGADEARPMQGQSPYLINAAVQYDVEKYGLTTTLLFNEIGRRIAYVGGSDQPPIWENPRPVLDFQVGKKIIKSKGELRLNVSDILNSQAIFYNDLDGNKKYNEGVDAFAIKRKYGTNISITFGYNF